MEKCDNGMWKPLIKKSPEVGISNEVGLLKHQKLMIDSDLDTDDEIRCPFMDNFGKWSIPLFLDNYYKCEKCERIFADKDALNTHLKREHPDRSIIKKRKCDYCSYSTDILTSFKNHMLTHTNEKPFECSRCGKKFSQKGNLKRHFRIHTKEFLYECNECGKKFLLEDKLKRHKRTVHDKLQPHVCEVCGSTFAHFHNYKSHMFTHTNARPYKCKECSAAFNHLTTLRRHIIARHTKNFPLECLFCGKGFVRPYLLKKHSSRCCKK